MSKLKICDVCNESLEDPRIGYRKIKSKYSDGSAHRVEHICDECWNKLVAYILQNANES